VVVPIAPTAINSGASARYRFSRLCFKADVIEPPGEQDVFEVATPHGTFRMTKAKFYADFPNVVASSSYREGRIYHYPKVPKVALKYLVSVNE
jgi:hypothetical protein